MAFRRGDISIKEMMAVILAVKTFKLIWQQGTMHTQTDNITLMWYIDKQVVLDLITGEYVGRPAEQKRSGSL